MISRLARRLVGAALLVGLAPSCLAQSAPQHPIALYEFPAGGVLKVTSPSFKNGGAIPVASTQVGPDLFPGLSWSEGPSGTRSYVVLIQDGNLLLYGGPMLHMSLFNISPGMTSLPSGMTSPPGGSHYGPSYHGDNAPYLGPHPDSGRPHAYHFEVFAIDRTLPDDVSNSGFTGLRALMAGHVLASGQIVATFQR